jgi:VanZ like protein
MFVKSVARLFVLVAWAALIAVGYATLARAGFVNEIYFRLSPLLMRPDRMTYGFIVHILAFAALGTLFILAYPRRLVLVCSIVLGGAVALEALQTLTQDRHGTVVDVLEKLTGGLAGIALGQVANRRAERREAARGPFQAND